MFTITLSDTERRIVDELHTDFTKIPDIEEILKAIRIHQSVDWYWSYSDQGSTLRHGEERVNKSVAEIMAIADKTGNELIRRLAKLHPASYHNGEYQSVFAGLFPWYDAYIYSLPTGHPAIAVELEVSGYLARFNEILDVMARQVWLFAKDMPPVYHHSILGNPQIVDISKTVGVPLNSLQTYIQGYRGIAVPERISRFASSTASLANELFSLLTLINFRGTRNFNLLAAPVKPGPDDIDLTIGFREAHINSAYKFLALSVWCKGTSFYIPVCAFGVARAA